MHLHSAYDYTQLKLNFPLNSKEFPKSASIQIILGAGYINFQKLFCIRFLSYCAV